MTTDELVPNPKDRILCVKVGKVKRENLYEMTRKYWKVYITRARRATHVLAIVDGIVEAVYIPFDWKYTEEPKHIGRCEFQGTEDEQTNYIGKSVTSFYGRSQNPVKYINMEIVEIINIWKSINECYCDEQQGIYVLCLMDC